MGDLGIKRGIVLRARSSHAPLEKAETRGVPRGQNRPVAAGTAGRGAGRAAALVTATWLCWPAYGFGPTTIRIMPVDGTWKTSGLAVAAETPPSAWDIACTKALSGLFPFISPMDPTACESALTTKVTPAPYAPMEAIDGWFISRGTSPGGIGYGPKATQPAICSIVPSWVANWNASTSSRGYIISTGAFGLPSKDFLNSSPLIWRGPICLRKRAVSLFNSAIFNSLASSMIFRYGAASRAAPNSMTSVTMTPKNAIVPTNSQSQYHHAALASAGFSTESPWWLDAGLACGLGALALLIRRRSRR
jgi:hypothetical protein